MLNQSWCFEKMSTIKKTCFVLMPFNPKEIFDTVYQQIKNIMLKLNIDCIRADEIFGTRSIIEDIQEKINNSDFLLADLTDRNPNVFYEVGLSHAIFKPVILITQKSKDVPFDVKHLRYIRYEYSNDGLKKLELDLKKTINVVLENIDKDTRFFNFFTFQKMQKNSKNIIKNLPLLDIFKLLALKNHNEYIQLFAYWLSFRKMTEEFSAKEIEECYNQIPLKTSTNTSTYLNRLSSKKDAPLIKVSTGNYKLSITGIEAVETWIDESIKEK